MRISKKAFSFLLAAFIAFSFAACVSAEKADKTPSSNKRITDGNCDQSLAVKCVNGTFVGRKTKGIITYKGIPFVGRQPVGALRWKAPVDVAPNDGVYEAYYNSKASCQHKDFSDYQGEDCLYLNVWKADEKTSKKKPVMVWIHGGGFIGGGTGMDLFDFTKFIKENPDVIVVSIQYRLGVMGFLHLSHLPDGKAKVWPLYDLKNRKVMVFDEFDIHPEKESERKILDWDRTYFLTSYYCL